MKQGLPSWLKQCLFQNSYSHLRIHSFSRDFLSAYCVPDIGNIIMTKTDSWIFHSSANSPTKPTDFYSLLVFSCGCTRVQALQRFGNCQNRREPVLFSLNVQYGWTLLLSSRAFVCEFCCQGLDPTFRNRDEASDKTEELFMREMKENRSFCPLSY